MHKGYIKLYRKFRDWQWYDDINCKVLFLELLLTVNFEDKKWQGIVVKSGSIITSIEHLSSNTGLTKQQVRTTLSKLEKSKVINKQTTNKYTLISLTKHDHYQSISHNDNKQITNKQQTNNNQITTTKAFKHLSIETLKNKDNNNMGSVSEIDFDIYEGA